MTMPAVSASRAPTRSPNKNSTAVSSVKQKNAGSTSCARNQPEDGSASPSAVIRASAACAVASRLLMLSRAKAGRRRARECFQIAPSLEKMEFPRRGMKVARRD